jgi:Uncharacterised nucleotidyltransferase
LDFARVTATIFDFLDQKGHPYALIGGVALAAYGLLRTTLDLDLVVDSEAQDELVGFLESRGYQTLHRSSGYSNHLHADPSWGRVDCLYVRGETSKELFAACQRLPGPGGIQVPVPKPEHLAALKALALKNDPERELQDLADVRFLLQQPGVDRRWVREYFARHGLKEPFDG